MRRGRTARTCNEDHFLVEVVDGELVITTLTKEALPLIRYRTGDIASVDEAPCACGRTLARMGPVRGRRDDMLILRGVNVYPSEIEHVLLGIEGVEPHYELTVRAARRVRRGARPLRGARRRRDDLAARVHEALRERTGIGIEVELVEPGPSRAARARPRGSSTSAEAQGSVALCATPPCVQSPSPSGRLP